MEIREVAHPEEVEKVLLFQKLEVLLELEEVAVHQYLSLDPPNLQVLLLVAELTANEITHNKLKINLPIGIARPVGKPLPVGAGPLWAGFLVVCSGGGLSTVMEITLSPRRRTNPRARFSSLSFPNETVNTISTKSF